MKQVDPEPSIDSDTKLTDEDMFTAIEQNASSHSRSTGVQKKSSSTIHKVGSLGTFFLVK